MMKKIFLLAIALCFVASLAVAEGETKEATVTTTVQTATTQPEAAAPQAQEALTVTLKGDIIDNMCAGAQKPETLAGFVAGHTKSCALMPACAASGYSIYTDGKLMKFDAASNAKIEEFLKTPDSKLQVNVVAKKAGEELNLVSIENQK